MIKQIKNGLIFGITAGISMLVIGASYAAWTTITRGEINQQLTAEMYNQMVDRLNSIEEKQLAKSWVNFNGLDCPSNICKINTKFNVDRVVRNDTGDYSVYFINKPSNNYYSLGGSAGNDGKIFGGRGSTTFSKDYVRVSIRGYDGSRLDDNTVSVQVFW